MENGHPRGREACGHKGFINSSREVQCERSTVTQQLSALKLLLVEERLHLNTEIHEVARVEDLSLAHLLLVVLDALQQVLPAL